MARMAEMDMVNGILLAGNLVFWGALFLCLGRKGRAARGGDMAPGTAGAAQAPGSCGGDWGQGDGRNGGGPGFGGAAETMRATVRATRPCFAQALAELLEFAVYGAGMIRLADLILQGIAGPGGENRALLVVRVLLAESMLLLFPLWRMSYRWKLEENGISGRNHSHGMGALAGAAAGFPQGRMGTVPEEGEGILGMLLLLGLTLQGWQEQDAVRALGRQVWLLLLFFCYGYLRRRRRLRWYGRWNGMAGEAAQGCGCSVPGMPVAGYERSAAGIWTEGYGKSAMESAPGPYGRKAPGMPPQGFARNTHQVRQMEYLRNVEEQYQRTRELWHDLKNHIKVLEILAQEERFGELTEGCGAADGSRQDGLCPGGRPAGGQALSGKETGCGDVAAVVQAVADRDRGGGSVRDIGEPSGQCSGGLRPAGGPWADRAAHEAGGIVLLYNGSKYLRRALPGRGKLCIRKAGA